jgi:competence protein ComFC
MKRPEKSLIHGSTLLNFNKLSKDLLHVLYPHHCLICNMEIPQTKHSVCPLCEHDLHYTNFESFQDNTPLDKLFWGRIQLASTYSLLYFSETNATRILLHQLKYKDRNDLAIYLGKQIAERIKGLPSLSTIDAYIPVPLHPKKEFVRGYNQSEEIAKGMQQVSRIPIDTQLVNRAVFTESQTKKDRLSRWENMQDKFRSQQTQKNYQHIAIIDDVITTGSTIETCYRAIRNVMPEVKISVITLAIAH